MHAFDQHRYQVRFEWARGGLARLAPAEIVVLVDVLLWSTTATDAVSRGENVALGDAGAAAIARAAASEGAVVMLGCLRNPTAVARAVLDVQKQRGERTSIAVIAAGEQSADGGVRVAVEDLVGAGAVVDALGKIGIDHTSPEAAAAGESFRGLRGAARHLVTASGSGQQLIGLGRRDEVVGAASVDAASVVPVLRDGTFVAHRE